MKIIGIICEYNPFHKGHKKQFDIIRSIHGEDAAIVCLMSGNYVQRGAPAIYDKMVRAEAALRSGADLVLELPITASLSSAEGFASIGVSILSPICDFLCFGTESNRLSAYIETANVLLSADFQVLLKNALTTGISFPAARQLALKEAGCSEDILSKPNDILAVEYCKAILQQNSKMQPMPILREGNYHDVNADLDNPSATALRTMIAASENYCNYTTNAAYALFKDATIHCIGEGERAILTKLRNMTEEEFSVLPYGSEGLWRKLMHAVTNSATLEEIATKTKSKRYTRTRIDRMIMCAYLGITEKDLEVSSPYTRILGFNNIGREIIKTNKELCNFVNIGETQDCTYQRFEERCTDLYALFAKGSPEPAGLEQKKRVVYIK